MSSLSIGELAKRAAVGVETVRFYERQGLLDAPARTASGYRVYDEEAVAVLRFVRRAKGVGFTLNEIKSLLALRSDPSATQVEVRKEAHAKLLAIDAKIEELIEIREALTTLLASCQGTGPASECPILETLNDTQDK